MLLPISYFMKEFVFPSELKRGETACAVYKMIFDDGSYYIGSSTNVKQRMWGWKFKLTNGIDKNYKVTAAFKATTKVVFEILEIIDDPILRKLREDGYIKLNVGKALFLNIASNAYTNKGIAQNPNKKRNISGFKPIARINDNGEIIEIFDCIADAEKKYEVSTINECLKNSRRKSKGMVFRLLDSDGNIIPAPTPVYKKPVRKRGYKLSPEAIEKIVQKNKIKRQSPDYIPPYNSKKINQYTLSGELVNSFLSIMDAARSMESNTDTFRKAISRSPNNFTKGYIWKYA